jgi:hypothetical protein
MKDNLCPDTTVSENEQKQFFRRVSAFLQKRTHRMTTPTPLGNVCIFFSKAGCEKIALRLSLMHTLDKMFIYADLVKFGTDSKNRTVHNLIFLERPNSSDSKSIVYLLECSYIIDVC